MTRLLKAAAALLCAIGLTNLANAQLTTITASHIYMGGVAISAGMVTFIPVSANGTPIPFSQGGGGLNAPTAFSCTVTAGAITGSCQVPDAALTTPANIFYQITVVKTSPLSSFVLQAVPNITGTTWPLDSYGPPITNPTVQPIQLSYGSAAPITPCVTPSLYIRNNGGGQLYMCVAGAQVLVTGSGGGSVTASAMQAALVAAAGCNAAGNDWQPQSSTCVAHLPLAGGTVTGPIVLPADPTTNLQAATKQYVDAHAGSSTVAALSGAIADYIFRDGTGTTLTDISGNAHNATLGTGAGATPSWTVTGLDFSVSHSGVQLPSALNTAKTFLFVYYADPVPQSALLAGTFFPLMTSSLGTSGLNFVSALVNAATQFEPNTYGLSTFVGTSNTIATITFSGLHTAVLVCGTSGTSVDHLYLDGNEVPNYQAQGTSCGAQTSGNLELGVANVSPWSSDVLNGVMYRVAVWSGALTSAQVQQYSGQAVREVVSRGVPFGPLNLATGQPTIVCDGDSITLGVGATPYCSHLTLTNQPTYTILNYGVNSIRAAALAGSAANRTAQFCQSANGAPTIALVLDGTNDFVGGANTGITAQFVWGSYSHQIADLKKAGCKVFVGTMLSRTGTGVNTLSMDANKDAYDALILSQAKIAGADGIIDFAADPRFGADGANANPAPTACSGGTCFQGDGIHPTTAGQTIMGQIASNALNRYFGSTAANPHVVATTTYTLVSGDGFVTAAPTANAAYTMPDCTGPSGETYTISNPQSAHTLTITGGASQPINGLSSAITIASNTTVTLRDVPNPKATSGCGWSM